MYTRNQGNGRVTPVRKGSADTVLQTDKVLSTDGMTGVGADNSVGMPILIPQDYHGEFLRGHRTAPSDHAHTEAETVPEESTAIPEMMETELPIPSANDIAPMKVEPDSYSTASSVRNSTHGNSLIGGLYDLLLGENSSEEETLLLLGIGLLLLWGHLDRGGLFDRSTWDADDLALLLIGYLLLS